jgi:hypothetical protein
LIAYLYSTRWDIEDIFGQVKNKLSEKKAWATSGIAKEMRTQFVCLMHNLMLILEDCIKKEGIDNDIENNRRSKRLKEVLENSKAGNKTLPDFLTMHKRPTQRSVKFIRWLCNQLFMNTSWREDLGPLQQIYAAFWFRILETVSFYETPIKISQMYYFDIPIY